MEIFKKQNYIKAINQILMRISKHPAISISPKVNRMEDLRPPKKHYACTRKKKRMRQAQEKWIDNIKED